MAEHSEDLVERHQELSWVSIHDASDTELRWMTWADDALAEMKRLREALALIAEWDGSQSLGYEGPRDAARAALSGRKEGDRG